MTKRKLTWATVNPEDDKQCDRLSKQEARRADERIRNAVQTKTRKQLQKEGWCYRHFENTIELDNFAKKIGLNVADANEVNIVCREKNKKKVLLVRYKPKLSDKK